MFTGIIENLGQIAAITPDGGNVHFDVTSNLAPELKIDQSVAHDGCCLTVVALHGEGGSARIPRHGHCRNPRQNLPRNLDRRPNRQP